MVEGISGIKGMLTAKEEEGEVPEEETPDAELEDVTADELKEIFSSFRSQVDSLLSKETETDKEVQE